MGLQKETGVYSVIAAIVLFTPLLVAIVYASAQ